MVKTAKQIVKKTVKKEVAKVKQARRGQAVHINMDLYNRLLAYAQREDKMLVKVIHRVLGEWADAEGI